MKSKAEYAQEYRKRYPWMNSFRHARYRCESPKSCKFYRYGGRGIKFLLTREEIKYLWFRDNAGLMKKPSIDRINIDGNYEISNCRFIELSENISLASRRNCLIRATDRKTGQVFISPTQKDLSRLTGISQSAISFALTGTIKNNRKYVFTIIKPNNDSGEQK